MPIPTILSFHSIYRFGGTDLGEHFFKCLHCLHYSDVEAGLLLTYIEKRHFHANFATTNIHVAKLVNVNL